MKFVGQKLLQLSNMTIVKLEKIIIVKMLTVVVVVVVNIVKNCHILGPTFQKYMTLCNPSWTWSMLS